MKMKKVKVEIKMEEEEEEVLHSDEADISRGIMQVSCPLCRCHIDCGILYCRDGHRWVSIEKKFSKSSGEQDIV